MGLRRVLRFLRMFLWGLIPVRMVVVGVRREQGAGVEGAGGRGARRRSGRGRSDVEGCLKSERFGVSCVMFGLYPAFDFVCSRYVFCIDIALLHLYSPTQ